MPAMLDVASKDARGQVLLVSSLDPLHPGANVIDGRTDTYWRSTGLYPQEILLELGCCSPIQSVHLVTNSVRQVRIEGSQEPRALNFEKLAEASLREASGHLQVEEVLCRAQSRPTCVVRVVILSGWHDFCSVHQVRVEVPLASALEANGSAPATTAPEPERAPPEGRAHDEAAVVEPEPQQQPEPLAAPSRPSQQASAQQWIERVQRDGFALRFAQDCAAVHEVALAAVQQSGDALQFASAGLRASREVVLAAVRKKGSAIRWAAEELRLDRELGLAAVGQSGSALQFCGAALRSDRGVVLAAVQQHGSALKWANRSLRGDPEVIELASQTYFWTKDELADLEAAGSEGEEEEEEESLEEPEPDNN